jgi:hypothetical protein
MRIAFKIALGTVLALVALGGAGLLYWDWVPLHRGSYVHANQALATSIGVPAGALRAGEMVQELKPASNALFVIGPQRTIGYALWDEYSFSRPIGLNALLAFYRHRLTGWTGMDGGSGGSHPWWTKAEPHEYQRGHASFTVSPQVTPDGRHVSGFTTDAIANDPYVSYFSP